MMGAMRRLLVTSALVAGVCSASPAGAANPWEDLMGHKPRTWSDPQGRFQLDLPLGWTSKSEDDSQAVEFWKQSDQGAVAHVTVTMKPVPPKVKVRHFAVHVEKDVKSHARGYQLVEHQKLQVSGRPAIRTHFTYRELGNAQLVNEVDQYVFIIGERAFVLTFEHALGARGIFAEDFQFMVNGFLGRSPGEDGVVGSKKRRRVRSGEMVNPDAVRY